MPDDLKTRLTSIPRRQLEEARARLTPEQRNASLKAAKEQMTDELLEQRFGKDGADYIKTLRQQLEQAEARVAELEAWAGRRPNVHDRDLRAEFAQWADEIGASNGAWLLRKQAEAVEALLDRGRFPGTCGWPNAVEEIVDYAQRLRSKADLLEDNDE